MNEIKEQRHLKKHKFQTAEQILKEVAKGANFETWPELMYSAAGRRNIEYAVDAMNIYAAQYTNVLEEELERAKELAPQWISVKDRLPKLGDTVLTFPHFKVLPFGERDGSETDFWEWSEMADESVLPSPYPTHWMPLPSPPVNS